MPGGRHRENTGSYGLTRLLATAVLALGAGCGSARGAPDSGCLIVGPFTDAGGATRVAARMHARGLRAEATARPALVSAYRVTIGGFTSKREALRAVKRLRRDGVHDLSVDVPGGGSPRISLGVYRNLSNALRRTEKAKLLGFKAHMDERFISGERWYVQVPGDATRGAVAKLAGMVPKTAGCVGTGAH